MIYTSLKNIKLFIFDVDGTLYDQKKLRNKMAKALFRHYILRPWKLRDILIIYYFRKERDKKIGFKGNNIQEEQYLWCANKVNSPVTKVKLVVDKWIFDFPNKYLRDCRYPAIDLFFETLTQNNISIAIYSDYESKLKMESLGLKASLLVSSTDSNINAMKPLPNGLNYILEELKMEDYSKCLFIGDREELDGECARRSGIPYLIINKEEARNNLYKNLSKQILNVN